MDGPPQRNRRRRSRHSQNSISVNRLEQIEDLDETGSPLSVGRRRESAKVRVSGVWVWVQKGKERKMQKRNME